MQIYIDNLELKSTYGISVLDYSGALSFAAERENEREWEDKSGVDKNLVNIRYDAKEFVLNCICKATNEVEAYNQIKALVDYMFLKGVFVLSLRDSVRNIRECYLCERSNTIVGEINVRQQNSLYYFKLGLKDVNPNAVEYKTEIVGNSVTIDYQKGQTSNIYWGNGSIDEVSNSGNYTKSDYAADGLVDIIIDVDSDSETVEALTAEFSADSTTADKPSTITFTDESTGSPVVWSWDFGDGSTSDLQDPTHEYTEAGQYTVTLQIFNEAQGSDVETKTNYITINNKRVYYNDTPVDKFYDTAGTPVLYN